MLFHQYYDIKSPPNDLEFFDLDITKDTKLFIDSYRLSQNKDNSYISNINKTLNVYMYQLLNLVRTNQRFKAHDLCPHFPETKGTGIGYTKNNINGKGAGKTSTKNLVDVMFESKAITSKGVSSLEECTVVCKGIAEDRTSDIVLGVSKLGFIKFTQSQCFKHSIPMQRTQKKLMYFCELTKQWQADYFDLPHVVNPNTNEEQYIILIPKTILSDKVVYTPQYFIRHILIPYFIQDAIRRNLKCVKTRKNGMKYVDFPDLLDYPEYYSVGKVAINDFVEKHPESMEQFRRIHAPYRYEQLNAA